jgi:formate-dependent nitrite reductase membrane component NrfD
MRKQRKEEIYKKEQFKRALIEWTVGILLVLSGIAGLAIVLYFIGRSQGKW